MFSKQLPVIRSDQDVTPQDLVVLSGLRGGTGYRKIAKTIGLSVGMVQQYVERLRKYEAIKENLNKVSGQGSKWTLTEKGDELCPKKKSS